ncbi:putative phenylalanyl-trna synthetase alpha subunit [Phaeomoniella chlamydospora]|uniref:Phenylalanine--tRNA ligase, mitochondrial n=1 Tax=Phaeomoniella chlamydospora TaxID=158046 RepID=A0A0G2G0H0_PHACM|nr:putative phenylalanyl-trna synthetase alpha subunit [Phaeomoniella chlamydospora]
MRLFLTGRVLRLTSPSWAATSLKQASRCSSSATVTKSKSSDNDWENQAATSAYYEAQKGTINAALFDVRRYSAWQRRILELNQPKKIVTEGDKRGIVVSGQPYEIDDEANLSSGILPHLERKLYLSEDHPLCITKTLVESVFQEPTYKNYFHVNPVVTTALNFDLLGFPKDHPGRSKTDTYYVNKDHVLRTHTSAHEDESFRKIGLADQGNGEAHDGFTLVADVFRRDSVDRSHYPVFHQMEGARTWRSSPGESTDRVAALKKDLDLLGRADLEVLDVESFTKTNPMQDDVHNPEEIDLVAQHLKRSLEHVIVKVISAARQARIGSGLEVHEEPIKARWVEAYFPFTAPSYELEVWWKGEWLELLGCGVSKQSILDTAGIPNRIGWAWGIGLERLAMLLFGIPDIRLFWSEDSRFLGQFKNGTVTEFKPFSKYPTCFKDVAFWIDPKPPCSAVSPANKSAPINSGPAAAAAAGGYPTVPQSDAPPPSSDTFHENDLMEIVRDIAGSLVEDVRLVDSFQHPKTGRRSLCYRINYRSLERTLTNEETNELHKLVLEKLSQLDVELR